MTSKRLHDRALPSTFKTSSNSWSPQSSILDQLPSNHYEVFFVSFSPNIKKDIELIFVKQSGERVGVEKQKERKNQTNV